MASGEAVSSQKRSRVSVGRVRTGCVTCKIRHLKCDEKKPACLRCVNSGRICDGYPPPIHEGKWWTAMATTSMGSINTFSLTPSIAPGSNPKERRFFHYFKDRTVDDLAGYFESPFWSQCVLQVGQSEPAVRHALVALGAVHEVFGTSDGFSLVGASNDEVAAARNFSLKQYNKAIRHLSQHLRTKGNLVSHKVTLICCLLFICFESIQGNYQASLNHLQSGLDILRDWNEKRSRTLAPKLPADSTNEVPNGANVSSTCQIPGDVIEETLLQLFSRLDLQATTFLDTRPPQLSHALSSHNEEASSATTPLPFQTLICARSALEEINSQLFRFLTTTYHYKLFRTPVPTSVLAEQATLERKYTAWNLSFDGLMRKKGAEMSVRDLRGAVLLKLHRTVTAVMLPNAFTEEETLEAYTEECRQIVNFAGSLLVKLPMPPPSMGATPSKGTSFGGAPRKGLPSRLSPNPQDLTPTYSFDMGIVAPLYFVAVRCRDRVVQREAIALLYSSGRREGMWDARVVAQIAEKIIGAKENAEPGSFGEIQIGGGVPDMAKLHGVLGVGEEDLLRKFEPEPDGGEFQSASYTLGLGAWSGRVERGLHPWPGFLDQMDGAELGGASALMAVGAEPLVLDPASLGKE